MPSQTQLEPLVSHGENQDPNNQETSKRNEGGPY
jgi:hypothetical protein